MNLCKNTPTFLLILSCILFISILCTDPAKPDFNEGASLTDKQVKASGTPVLGSSFLLYVSAEGTAPLFYQWYKDSIAVSNAKDDTLTFDALSVLNAGIYQCIVWNDYGSDTTFEYTLSVLSPPTITTANKQILASTATPEIDSSFSMTITATGSDTLKYKWYKGITLLQDSTYDSLKFAALAYTDTGSYQCIVTNTWGSDTSAVYTLSVTGNNPPVWVRDTMTDITGVGSTFKISLPDSCTDPDGDSITFTLAAGPPGTRCP